MTRGHGLLWLIFVNQVIFPAFEVASHFPELHGEGGYLKNSGKEEDGGNGCLRDKSIVTTTSTFENENK